VEGQPAATPLKVCRHCSVASRTDAEACPSCGTPYGRRRLTWRWSWWFAIPIVAAAFLVGLLVIGPLIRDDSGEAGITVQEAGKVPDGISQAELEDRVGETPTFVQRRQGASCAYYPIEGQPRSVWEFCFEREELVGSRPLWGSGTSRAAPAPNDR
jgi:hypothetical protein